MPVPGAISTVPIRHRSRTRPVWVLAAGSVLVAAGVAGCGRIDTDGVRDRQEKRFTVKGTPDVRLATFDGSIVIRGWDRDEVSVEIEKRGRDPQALEDIDIVTEHKGNAVAVEVREMWGDG